jgi:hypothetical protein
MTNCAMKGLHWMGVPYIAHNLQLGDASEE